MKIKYFIAVIIIVFFQSITNLYSQETVRVRLNDEFSSLNLPLPKDYMDRTFLKGLAMYRNRIDELVGSLILVGANEKISIIDRIVETNQIPIENTILSDVLYSSKVNSSATFNGSYMIASASAERTTMLELIITDVSGVLIPEESIPFLKICKASKNVEKANKADIYYIKSVKLSTILSRTYRKVTTSAAVSGVVFSVDGEVYNSSDQFKTDYSISVDLVSLNSLLLTKNCDEIINSYEIAERLKSEKIKQEALNAENEKKIKENQLNTAQAEVNALLMKLHDTEKNLSEKTITINTYKSQIDSLKSNLTLANENVHNANKEFIDANHNAKKITEDCANQLCTTVQQGKQVSIPVISEVKKLSSEEISKLGYNISAY